jgi:hypothetical protein
MQGTLAGRLRTFADFNFLIVNVRQQLTEVAHVEIGPADWAIAEMIGLGFGDAISVSAGCCKQSQSFNDLISKDDAFRVVLLEPRIGEFWVCENLEMIGMADIVVGVDVNPDHLP